MSDPVAELAAELADMKRRLHALETAPRATKTSVSGGYTRWLPANGEEYPKVYAGALGDDHVGFFVDQDDGDDGSLISADLFMGVGSPAEYTGSTAPAPFFFIANPDHQMFASAAIDGVLSAPGSAAAWTMDTNVPIDSLGRRYATSGTYTTLASAVLPLHSKYVESGFSVIPQAGATSMDMRVTIRGLNMTRAVGSNVTLSSTAVVLVEETGITSGDTVTDRWEVPNTLVTPNGSPIGILCELLLQARVAAGSGQAVAAPYQAAFCRPVDS